MTYLILRFNLISFHSYFKFKPVLIFNLISTCLALPQLFLLRDVRYRHHFPNPLLNPDFQRSIGIHVDIYYYFILFLLPINLFFFQYIETKNAFSNRINFYPIKPSSFFYQRLWNYYLLVIIFTVIYLTAFGIRIGNNNNWNELPVNELIAIIKKLLVVFVAGQPYIIIITLLSFYIKNIIIGIFLHFSLMYLGESHTFFYSPSSWSWITSFHYLRYDSDTFYKELPFSTLTIIAILCIASVILWVEYKFKQNQHEL